MLDIAKFLARRLWYGMLWLIRRPWVRRWQRASYRMLPPRIRDRAWQVHLKQERFARKWGLPTLTVAIAVLMFSIALTMVYWFVVWLWAGGWLSLPQKT